MPDEYISREAAVKYIKSEQCRTCSDIGLCGNCAVLVAVKLLEKVPASDVAEVVHGWWKKVRKSRSTWECSVCGTKVGAFFAGCSQYCYCCGAQMGGITE